MPDLRIHEPTDADCLDSIERILDWFREECPLYDGGFVYSGYDSDTRSTIIGTLDTIYLVVDQPAPPEWRQERIDRTDKEIEDARLASRLYPERSGYQKKTTEELINELGF